MEVAQVHREPLDKLLDIFKYGKVYGPYGPYSTNKQPYFVYTCYGTEAVDAANKMKPYLFQKSIQIDKALNKYEEYYLDNN